MYKIIKKSKNSVFIGFNHYTTREKEKLFNHYYIKRKGISNVFAKTLISSEHGLTYLELEQAYGKIKKDPAFEDSRALYASTLKLYLETLAALTFLREDWEKLAATNEQALKITSSVLEYRYWTRPVRSLKINDSLTAETSPPAPLKRERMRSSLFKDYVKNDTLAALETSYAKNKRTPDIEFVNPDLFEEIRIPTLVMLEKYSECMSALDQIHRQAHVLLTKAGIEKEEPVLQDDNVNHAYIIAGQSPISDFKAQAELLEQDVNAVFDRD